MEKLTKFRMLAEQLNEEEGSIFLQQLINTSDIYNLIISSIFHYFVDYILKSKQFNSDQIDSITKIIAQIIESRASTHKSNENDWNDNDDDSSENEQYQIDDMANPVISIISSFLPQKDYIAFQLCNRKLLIGCNSPCSLRSCILPSFKNPTNINTKKCVLMSNLSIDPSANTIRDKKNVAKTMQNILSNENHTNFSNITRFTCGSFNYNYYENEKNAQLFFNLLSKFPNMQYLDVENISIWRTKNLTLSTCSNLIGISLTDSCLPVEFIQTHSHQITSLCLFSSSIDQGLSFPKLRELKISISRVDSLKRILKSTNCLRIVCIHVKVATNYVHFGNVNNNKKQCKKEDSVIKQSIMELFKTQKKLNYFEINVNKNWDRYDDIIDSLCAVFSNSINMCYQKNEMKIQIILKDNRTKNDIKWDKVMSGANRLIDVLKNCSNITNWMLSVAIVRKKNCVKFEDKDKQRLECLAGLYLVNHFQEDTKFKFVIGNKENPMKGGYNANGAYCF